MGRDAEGVVIQSLMDKTAFRQKIEDAFGCVAYPGDNAIAAPGSRDDGETVEEILWEEIGAH